MRSFFFQNKTTRQTILKNAVWFSLSQILAKIFRAIVVIAAARILGAGQWGFFSYLLSIGGLISVLADFGINGYLTREISQTKGEMRQQFIATVVVLKLLILIIIASILSALVLLLPITTPEKILAILIIGITVIENLRDLGSYISYGLERFEWDALSQITTSGLLLLFVIVFLYFYQSPQALAGAYVLSHTIGILFYAPLIGSILKKIKQTFTHALIPNIFQAAWYFSIPPIMSMIIINTDIILLGLFRSLESVGWYAAIQRIMQFLMVIPAFIITPLFPALSRLTKENQGGATALINRSSRLLLILALPPTIGGIVFSSEIVTFLFGTAYAPASSAFQLISASLPFLFLYSLFCNIMLAFDKKRIIFLFAFFGILSNTLLDFIFIPLWGINGVAVATLVTFVVVVLFLSREIKKMLKTIHFNLLNPLIVGGITMIIALIFAALRLHFSVALAFLFGIFFFLLFIRKDVFFSEIKQLKNIP